MVVMNSDSRPGQVASSRSAGRGRSWLRLALAGGAWTAAVSAAGLWLLPETGLRGGVIAGLTMAIATVIAATGMARHYPHARPGACNQITLSRVAPVGLLAAVLVTPGGLSAGSDVAWMLVALVTLGLCLDGVDGWLARRSGLTSAFGARFDMEVDSALAGFLAAVALASGKAGIWVLALGFLRYGFVAAMWVWPWLDAPLPPSLRRKTICAMQIFVLIALLAPVVQPPLSVAVGLAMTLVLAWSFAVDIRHLWRVRG